MYVRADEAGCTKEGFRKIGLKRLKNMRGRDNDGVHCNVVRELSKNESGKSAGGKKKKRARVW